MQSKNYSFGGIVFRLNFQEELIESKYTAPFLCEDGKKADFVISVDYSKDVSEISLSDEKFAEAESKITFSEKYRGKISSKNVLEEAGIFRMLQNAAELCFIRPMCLQSRARRCFFLRRAAREKAPRRSFGANLPERE